LRRLAALLPADPALAETVAARLRLSAAQKKRLALAADRQPDDAVNPRGLAYRLGRTEAQDRLLLNGGDCAPLDGWDIPRFALKGGTIVARGIHAGPDVARILRAVENHWIAEGFPDDARIGQLLDAEINRPG
jgi:poly(A) polymerase